jgi:hypothetical protein
MGPDLVGGEGDKGGAESMTGNVTFKRRDAVQFAGLALAFAGFVAGYGSSAVAVFMLAQIVAGLDVLLFFLGRFVPRATLWAIRVERFLGPFPWKRR